MELSPRLLAAPLLILGGTAVVLLIAAVLAWGAAGEVGGEDWLPTYAGGVVGTTILAGALLCYRNLREKTAIPYRVRKSPLLAGLVLAAFLAVFCLLSAVSVGDPERYDQRFESDSQNIEWDDPSLEPGPFVVIIALICFPGPISWLLYGVKKFYVEAVEPVSDTVEGVDPMGEIMGTT